MSVYADASLLVALFTPDLFNARAQTYVETHRPALVISDFAAAEFASAVARRVRTRELNQDQASAAFSAFDTWSGIRGQRAETKSADVANAEALLRCLDLSLRTSDALNIAIAQRIKASLATFDIRMAQSAEVLGLEIAPV